MILRALLFDLWGTLLHDNPQRDSSRWDRRIRLLQEAFESCGEQHSSEVMSSAMRSVTNAYRDLQWQGRDVSAPEKVELFLEAIASGKATTRPAETLAALEEAMVAPGRSAPPVPAPGAFGALQEGRRHGLSIGLVSNTGLTPGYVLREALSAHGMLLYLDVLTLSDEARLAKPAPEVFRCTLDTIGVAPEDAVFVGDVPDFDVTAPLDLGMWTVLVGDRPAEGPEPHARIDTLHDLFDALRQLHLVD